MNRGRKRTTRRGTVLLMIVSLLAMLFMIVSAYIILARHDRQSLQLVNRAERVSQIIDSIEDVVADALRSPGGSAEMVTGANYSDIPGYGGTDPNDGPWGSPWLASAEPVRDPATSNTWPEDYRFPAVTGISGNAVGTLPLTGLMLDADADGTMEVYPVSNPDLGSLTLDTAANAREPFTDADGDGIPDSSFAGVAVLTELANAMAGRAVRAQDINIANLDPNDHNSYPDYLRWQQFVQQSRYAAAVRIISHGGMVQVSAPSDRAMWNSQFLGQMFNWVRHPWDSGSPTLDELYAMWTSSGAVEPILRRRGGLLAGQRSGGELSGSQAGLPEALRVLQTRFPYTFNPQYDRKLKADNWQRFNLASLNEWNVWRQAASLDAEAYNDWWNYADPGLSDDPRMGYVRRQLLTTVNNSDELARIMDPNSTGGLGLRPGQLKFYLGRITDMTLDPNDGYPRGAFLATGHFNDRYPEGRPRGFVIIRELADYFYEMLSGHRGWAGTPDATEAVTLRQQAFMLAVNTVAFAAPRDGAGQIDTVHHCDGHDYGPSVNRMLYIGYKPQPFITQAVLYYAAPKDPNDPNTPSDPNDPNGPSDQGFALAVELYNPNDPADPALDLTPYAITVDDPNEVPSPPAATGGVERFGITALQGRQFAVLDVHASHPNDPNGPKNGFFSGLADEHVPIFIEFKPKLVVRLWCWTDPGAGYWPPGFDGWYVVDEMEIDTGKDSEGSSDWYVNTWRDMRHEPYLGPPGSESMRWRMTVAFPCTRCDGLGVSPCNAEVVDGRDPSDVLGQLREPEPLSGPSDNEPNAVDRVGPCTPFYTMNADPNDPDWPGLHGVWRPPSFPTVGFMLFIPRFCHYAEVRTDGTVDRWRPMSAVLHKQWQAREYGTTDPLPADFGHMPIFDNNQEEDSDGPLHLTGRIPWGLLVYDYFTTLNPDDADGDGVPWQSEPGDSALDPYRVPGRININTAPWYVLAGLPVIGPVDHPTQGDLPLAPTASHAFWDNESGVLAGTGFNGTARFASHWTTTEWLIDQPDPQDPWYRLGPYLAQAAAAYRDRVQYVREMTEVTFAHADWRNYGGSVGYAYRPGHYGSIRGQGDPNDPNAGRGFLTVGELANVMGFDGSNRAELQAAPSGTVLGGYGTASGGDFLKAVSRLALLDTHFLTTRSNTFTIYLTLVDRINPQASVRSQLTVDRSNLLPRLVWTDLNGNGIQDPEPDDRYTVVENNGLPEIIGQREVSYFNARYDE